MLEALYAPQIEPIPRAGIHANAALLALASVGVADLALNAEAGVPILGAVAVALVFTFTGCREGWKRSAWNPGC